MTQTSGRLFDDLARLMTDAAGIAEGMRREVDTVVKGQAERILKDLDVVSREEFEAVKDMARKARDENERLEALVLGLSARLRALEVSLPKDTPPEVMVAAAGGTTATA